MLGSVNRLKIVVVSGAALLIAAAVVVALREQQQPVPPPDVPVSPCPAEVRVKAVERKLAAVVTTAALAAPSAF